MTRAEDPIHFEIFVRFNVSLENIVDGEWDS